MRILMINASPKKNGATEQVLQWMKEALEEQYETESVCLGERSIAFCRGCKQCYKTGRCVLPADGVEELLHRMERNDAILFAVPSYWGDVPAQFKALIDRCTPYADTNPLPGHPRPAAGKRVFAAALRAGGRTGECEHLLQCVEHWSGHMGAEYDGGVMLTRVDGKEDLTLEQEVSVKSAVNAWISKK